MGSLAVNLLLDTHILLWIGLNPQKLTANQIAALDSPNTQVWLSPISAWECLILAERGRLALRPDPVSWWKEAFKGVHAREAALTQEVAFASRSVGLPHQDPADRFLAGTAAVYDLQLVTQDQNLLKGTGFPLFCN